MFFLAAGFCFQIFAFADNFSWIVFVSMMIVGVADPLAALAGSFYPKGKYNLTGDAKTLSGSSVFMSSTVLVVVYSFYYLKGLNINGFPQEGFLYISAAVILISIVLTAVEAISSLGSDNLFILIFAPVLLFAFFNQPNYSILGDFGLGISLAGIVALISSRLRFLTVNGSTATFLLAGFIFGFGGWKWSLPIMTFFILSSLLSKFRKSKNEEIELYFEKTGTRDYQQVLANGGIGGVLVIINLFFPLELWYYLYLGSLAAVCADTWATEIGTMRRSATYNVLTFKPIEQGISGGISIKGTLGAFAGASVISLSGLFWREIDLSIYFLVIILSGIAGSFFDSILGATIQHQRQCSVCGKITEREIHCEKPSGYFRGIKWINNDAVNFFAGVFGMFVLFLIIHFAAV